MKCGCKIIGPPLTSEGYISGLKSSIEQCPMCKAAPVMLKFIEEVNLGGTHYPALLRLDAQKIIQGIKEKSEGK